MWDSELREEVRRALGDAFLAGDWTGEGLTRRARSVVSVGVRAAWLPRLVQRTLEVYPERPADRPREFHAWLAYEIWPISQRVRRVAVIGRLIPIADMGPMRWPVPRIATTADLAAFLSLTLGELAWLGDLRGLERTVPDERLRNYRYRWIPRDRGVPRLLECPKPLLKETQRQVLRGILELIPPHPDAQGFRRGHSPLTNARRHIAQEVVIGFDVEDFFASVAASRVYGTFRSAGYPEGVAHHLTALCTNIVPLRERTRLEPTASARDVGRQHRLHRRLAAPHLPQGSPTSPALANLAAFGLDRRLSALAAASGASYSRYADDLTFSGSKRLLASAKPFRALVAEIVEDEGFRLNRRKSRLTTRAGRQAVTGIVVNEHPNLGRREYDALRATLHDAALRGHAHANRAGLPDLRSHLLGRIGWFEQINPARGAKLRRMFAAIEW